MKKYLIAFFAMGLWACQNNSQSNTSDTVAMGHVAIAADESLRPMVESLEGVFESINTAAEIDFIYKPEQESINLMLRDSARVAIVTRELTAQEKKVFEAEKIRYRSLKVAVDAVALIVGNNVKDTLITFNQIKKILSGADKSRKIIVDNANSSNLSCLINKLGFTDVSKLNIYALNGNKEVVEYVQKNSNAIGLIGVNWISDGDDPASMGFLRSINVMSVSEKDNPGKDEYYKPFEYNLYLNNYPIARNVLMITKEARQGLGTGFINFASHEKGQLIIQKTGILPATQPLRLYTVKH